MHITSRTARLMADALDTMPGTSDRDARHAIKMLAVYLDIASEATRINHPATRVLEIFVVTEPR